MKKLSKTKELKGSKLKGLMSSKRSVWFTIIVVVSVIGTLMAGLLTTFLSGEVEGTRGYIQASAGLISFALIYVASDIISEVYGYKASRIVAFINIGASLLLTILIFLGGVFSTFIIDPNPAIVGGVPAIVDGVPVIVDGVPAIAGGVEKGLMKQVAEAFFNMNFDTWTFNSGNYGVPAAGLIILVWGWAVGMIGDWANDVIFKKFKSKDGQNKFFKRSFLSSVVGQLVDVLVFVPVLVAVVIPPSAWFNEIPNLDDGCRYLITTGLMMGCQLVFKLSVELICYPITRLLKKKMVKTEGLEAYEEGKGYGLIE